MSEVAKNRIVTRSFPVRERRVRRWACLLGAGTLLIGAAPVGAQTKVRRHGRHAVAGEYIVVLKGVAPGSLRASSAEASRSLTASHGGRVMHSYRHALNGFSARLTAAQARALSRDPSVAFVAENARFRANQAASPWGVDRLNQRLLPLDGNPSLPGTGKDVHIYVVDTRLRPTHVEFKDAAGLSRVEAGFDALPGADLPDCVSPRNAGHATHVAGTAAGRTLGVAKEARLHSVRVLDDCGAGTTDMILRGIDWIIRSQRKPAVANFSLGGPGDEALNQGVRNLIAAGVTTVAAAGNTGDWPQINDACYQSPAQVSEAITVGATRDDDLIPTFSYRGPCVDVLAPGVRIPAAWDTDDTAGAYLSGTSMATPHVAGLAALYLEKDRTALPATVGLEIYKGATAGAIWFYQDEHGIKTRQDWGTPNLLANVNMPGLRGSALVPVPADYDGDGRADVAAWGPFLPWPEVVPIQQWVIRDSRGTRRFDLGAAGDTPLPADFDGDGKADPAVFSPRRASFVIVLSNFHDTRVVVDLGLGGDMPVVGDFNGDRRADLAVWRPSRHSQRPDGAFVREDGLWQIKYAPADGWSWPIGVPAHKTLRWGTSQYGDLPFAKDFDSDGRVDLAVWRRATNQWFFNLASGGAMAPLTWASANREDVPLAGNYAHDGRAELAVWRPAGGVWYVKGQGGSTDIAVPWGSGALGDIPAPADFDGDGLLDYVIFRPGDRLLYVKYARNLATTVLRTPE